MDKIFRAQSTEQFPLGCSLYTATQTTDHMMMRDRKQNLNNFEVNILRVKDN